MDIKYDQFNVQAEKLWPQISPYFFKSWLLVEANKAASGTCYVIIRVKLIWISQLCIVQRVFLTFIYRENTHSTLAQISDYWSWYRCHLFSCKVKRLGQSSRWILTFIGKISEFSNMISLMCDVPTSRIASTDISLFHHKLSICIDLKARGSNMWS